jgi:hypothetical protein
MDTDEMLGVVHVPASDVTKALELGTLRALVDQQQRVASGSERVDNVVTRRAGESFEHGVSCQSTALLNDQGRPRSLGVIVRHLRVRRLRVRARREQRTL